LAATTKRQQAVNEQVVNQKQSQRRTCVTNEVLAHQVGLKVFWFQFEIHQTPNCCHKVVIHLSEEFVQVLPNFLAARQKRGWTGKQTIIHDTGISISQQEINISTCGLPIVLLFVDIYGIYSL